MCFGFANDTSSSLSSLGVGDELELLTVSFLLLDFFFVGFVFRLDEFVLLCFVVLPDELLFLSSLSLLLSVHFRCGFFRLEELFVTYRSTSLSLLSLLSAKVSRLLSFRSVSGD